MGKRDERRKKSLNEKHTLRNNKNKDILIEFKYILTIEYDGSSFIGYAKQKFKNTIQQTLEEVLENVLGTTIKTIESSRTDKGVHAYDQKIMFSHNKKYNLEKLKNNINSKLPSSIRILKIDYGNDDFHVRYDVVSKTYIYKLHNIHDLFIRNYSHFWNRNISQEMITKINSICELFIGEHDFILFSSSKRDSKTTIRNIFSFQFTLDPNYKNNHYLFTITGNGFLYKMIRILIGSIIFWIENDYGLSDIETIIKTSDKNKLGETAPSNGLYLEKINYLQEKHE